MGQSKRSIRRERGRAKEEAAFAARYPGHRIVKGPLRLAVSARDLRATAEFLSAFDVIAQACGQPILLDLHHAAYFDAAGCVMLAAAMQRCRLRYGHPVKVRMPRNGLARFALTAFGVAGDELADDDASLAGQVMKVSSGAKGDPSPGARTFEVAQLAEGLVADETLADRVHAALNEAADNVLSWAYGPSDSPADPAERWWVAGLLTNRSASFVALDHGAGIPATAPQNFGDALTGYIKTMIEEREWRRINLKPTDAQILQATIAQRRTVSRLDERGKGLNNMIALIDLFPAGFINIFSGDAVYTYRNPAAKGGQKELCSPLGFHFPGTLILWQLKAKASEART